MELRTVGSVINVIVMAAYATVAIRTGYRRRKDHWSRGSWLGLGLALLAGFGLLGFMVFFSASVGESPSPWVGAAGSSTRVFWILITLAAMVGGVGLTAGTLTWFARGRPTTPFPLARRPARQPSHPAVSERPAVGFGPNQPNRAAEAVAAQVEHH